MSTWQLCSSYPPWHWANTQKSSSKPFWEALALSSHTHKCTKKKSPTLFSRMFLLTFPLGNDYQRKNGEPWSPPAPPVAATSWGHLHDHPKKLPSPEPLDHVVGRWPLVFFLGGAGAVVVMVVVAGFLPIESSLEKNKGKFKKSQKENSSYCNIKTPNWPKIEDLFWSRSTVTNSWVLKVEDFLGWVYMTHIERPCKIPTQCNWGPGTKRQFLPRDFVAETTNTTRSSAFNTTACWYLHLA